MVDQKVITALNEVRQSSSGDNLAEAQGTIELAIEALWAKIRKEPNTYLMDKDEFALFNFFRTRYESGEDGIIAKAAVARYWDSIK